MVCFQTKTQKFQGFNNERELGKFGESEPLWDWCPRRGYEIGVRFEEGVALSFGMEKVMKRSELFLGWSSVMMYMFSEFMKTLEATKDKGLFEKAGDEE